MGLYGRFPFRVVPPPARRGSCMARRFLSGLLSQLPPLLLQIRPRMLSPESVLPSKRPRSSLMAPPRIGTHNGTFHCDEALACALLRLLPEYRVQPARNTLGLPAFPSRVPGVARAALELLPTPAPL